MAKMCIDCGRVITGDGIFTGYGITTDGSVVCFDCCGTRDREKLLALNPGESMAMYLTRDADGAGEVTNWPGTFRIRIHATRRGRHNFAGSRTDVWFPFGGNAYHGVQYGSNTDVIHVTRVKRL